jgi:hypothetical protein
LEEIPNLPQEGLCHENQKLNKAYRAKTGMSNEADVFRSSNLLPQKGQYKERPSLGAERTLSRLYLTGAQQMTRHKTRSVFDPYNIVSQSDLFDCAKRLDSFTGIPTGMVSRKELQHPEAWQVSD